jgi:molecular chaperone HtpG
MSKYEFQTEVSDLLDLMVHSLYSNKEIFLRELISNASDALDKLNYLTLTDDKFKKLDFSPKITIELDEKNSKMIISDNGIGMNKDDLITNLGTIAKSGTKSFIEALSSDKKEGSELIGQFGVGFYSAFMVANKIEVLSKKAGEKRAYKWISEGGDSFEIEDASKDEQGTVITLFIDEKDKEFLSEYRVKSIVEKYSNHIPFPIFLKKEEEGEKKEEQINKASALWRLPKKEISDEEYKEFYKSLSHDNDDPLLWIHTKAEGTLEYTTLFYIPKKAPFDLYRVDYKSGVKLYVKRVFISDDDKELLPTYLRFVRGVFDVEDLPLNVSREILQENIILTKVKKASVKKILSELKKLKSENIDRYKEFYKTFGRVLKEGIMSEFENRELLLDLLMFKSLKSDDLIDLKTYKDSMKEDQKEIYYIIGEDSQVLKNSPLLESFKDKDIDVLLMDEEVDTIVVPQIGTFEDTPLSAVNHTNLAEDEETLKKKEEEFKELTLKIKEILKDEVKDVRVTTRLKNSPSCLVYDKDDPDFAMQQMLRQMGQSDLPQIKPILEINPQSPIFKTINDKKDFAKLNQIAPVVLDLAKLSEGMKIDDVAQFSQTITKLLEDQVGK